MSSVPSVEPSLTITHFNGFKVCATMDLSVNSMNAASFLAGVIITYRCNLVSIYTLLPDHHQIFESVRLVPVMLISSFGARIIFADPNQMPGAASRLLKVITHQNTSYALASEVGRYTPKPNQRRRSGP